MTLQIILSLFVVYFFFAWHYTYNNIISTAQVKEFMNTFDREQPKKMIKTSALFAAVIGFIFVHKIILAKKRFRREVKQDIKHQINTLKGIKVHYERIVDSDYLEEDKIQMIKDTIKAYEKAIEEREDYLKNS